MNCLLLLCLSGLYFEGGAGYVFSPPEPPPKRRLMFEPNHVANPMGRIAFGHEWNPSPRARISIELRHESWLGTTRDVGLNSAWASVRVLPWAN